MIRKGDILCAIGILFIAAALFAMPGKEKDADSIASASVKTDKLQQNNGGSGLEKASEELELNEEDLKKALGDPEQGPPDFEKAAEKLGISAEKLESVMKKYEEKESVEVDPYVVSLNGRDFEITYDVFSWKELPSDVEYERQPVREFTNSDGVIHYYEAIYVESGNLNWYQAAFLAEDAGGYLACPASEEENSFVFSLVDDEKYFWSFPENGNHYGISIGPFLGGYQPDGSEEPAGGWKWLSGEEMEYKNWAKNLDDGVVDKDPRPNDQPNNSGGDQPIMGFGEMNLPVPTWGDYFEAVGSYGLKKSPGKSYGFIIEYEEKP